jgi:putative hydrolase of the HAD superfamily
MEARMAGLAGCRAILFDFGGTLDSDGEHWLDRFQALYANAGVRRPPADIQRAFYRADTSCCRDPRVNRLRLRPLMRLHVRLQLRDLDQADRHLERRLVDGFCAPVETCLRRNVQVLRRLRGAFRLGVVSNFYGNVDVLCREAGLADVLDAVVDSERVGVAKPDPEIFRVALDTLRVTAAEAAFVGDSYERDMRPARQLGMTTVWLRRPGSPDAHHAHADHVIASLPALEALAR